MNRKTLFSLIALLPLLLMVGCKQPSRSVEIDQIKIKINLVQNFPIEFASSTDASNASSFIPSGVVLDKVFDFDYKKLCKENNLDPNALEQFDLYGAVITFDNLPKESITEIENLELCIKDKDGSNRKIAKVKKGQNDSEIEMEIIEKDLKKFLDQGNLHLLFVNQGESFTIPKTKAALKLNVKVKAALYNK